MTDSLKQSDGRTGSFASSDLDARLWRRAIEPLGVIDVRYAQRKYLRLVQWLASRASLLDRVRTLYGVEEALITGEHPLAEQHPFGQQVDVFSTTIQSFSPAAGAQDGSRDVQQHHVEWDARPSNPDVRQHHVESDARPSSLAEIIAERSTRLAGEQEASLGERFRISRRPPAMLARSGTESSIHPRATAKVQPPAPEHTAASRQSHTDSSSPDAGPGSEGQQPRGADVTEAPITNQEPADFVFKRTIVENSATQKRDAIRSTGAQEEPAAAATVRNERGGAPSIARQSDREIANVQSTVKSQVTSLPLIKPLAGDSLSMEMQEMVLRKQGVSTQAADFMAQGSSASEPPNSTQSSQGAFASRARQSERIGTQAKAHVETDEVRVEHISPGVIRTIAERVVRSITLDLKVERERRGVTKWR